MHWLCKLIGHKHKGSDICTVWYHGEYCLRCNASTASVAGDGVIRCTVFGHHHECNVVGDDGGYKVTTAWCQRCHAMPASHFKAAARD